MRLGIEVNQQGLEWREILERVRFVEEAGFDGAWVFDHFKPISGHPEGPCLEGWTLLAALSAATTRIRLGALVTGITYRYPSVLAAEAVTVDHVSQGRLEIGLGAAWFEGEHRELGIPFPGTRERAERLEEGIRVMRALMTRDHASLDGRYYQLRDATYHPWPVQRPHPPIWIGAQGEKLMLPITARQADVWHASAPLDVMVRKSTLLDRYAWEAGRNPSDIARAGSIRLSDPWDEVRRTAEGFWRAGFSYLVCTWPDEGTRRIGEFAEGVMGELRSL
jgi:alkanesulfonate monooxygenase SsuD/methylene tetrahydromethanopterin reductase-like flavin-dependent oxidoreductase (luciferase family)